MIEKIYTDFTTKLLPELGKGIAITKDYFMDFFGRYIKYLIMIDSLALAFWIILSIIGAIIVYKGIKNKGETDKYGDISYEIKIAMLIMGGCILALALSMTAVYANLLIQDLFVPEIRAIDIIKTYK